jgi:hypothetical protein
MAYHNSDYGEEAAFLFFCIIIWYTFHRDNLEGAELYPFKFNRIIVTKLICKNKALTARQNRINI